jgi:hypothetical protein
MNLKSGGLHEKLAVATSNLGTISAFALRRRKTKKKKKCRDGHLQDLPNAFLLLVSSPANKNYKTHQA